MVNKNTSLSSVGHYILYALSSILIVMSLLSLLYDIPKWYLKILDFPRLQYLIVGILFIVLLLIFRRKWNKPFIFLLVGLLSVIAIQTRFLFPYIFGSVVVPQANYAEKDSVDKVSIMIANILIKNRTSKELREIINKSNPDMILAMEVDAWWIEQLGFLEKKYPHSIKYPTNNAYGMALYSKLKLENSEILFLNHSEVPAFKAKVLLESGKNFNFYGVHPVAPFPSDKYPENIGDANGDGTQEEVALLKVGDMVAKDEKPTIVAGDFNDVAWSQTSRLFGENGNLKDVRIGRGLHNTFNAKSWIMRWPLDHYYVSDKISVVKFKRMEDFNSDHFPMFAEFVIK
ncbi:endonuclease/exonuclease/phosphatase family protein [Gramella sp. AN32]|uniref:Endonuclease/exonuclease/phosphatase family protein n=1 Tax=Christiangramia antarctica TaxID=2058158 RepID=A0ABW5X5F5_9FLAO|nr:endonuclease/exonuclease/phosphatase family protein [Gramella sp. AN32]MCM4157644.1 endonuclease [Gramella sp. AN32]